VGISINPTDEKRRLVVIGATPTRKKSKRFRARQGLDTRIYESKYRHDE
jgi:hypothetical protein